jgi:hypothetical protein
MFRSHCGLRSSIFYSLGLIQEYLVDTDTHLQRECLREVLLLLLGSDSFQNQPTASGVINTSGTRLLTSLLVRFMMIPAIARYWRESM